MGRLNELDGEQKGGGGGRRAEMSWSHGMDGLKDNEIDDISWLVVYSGRF